MKTKKFFLSVALIALATLSGRSMDLNIGETTVLDLGKIQRLEKCEWRISRPDAIEFVSAPEPNSTSVTVKALKTLDGAPCTIECTYYYYTDIDPRSGRHMFSRTATKRWEIWPTVCAAENRE